MPRKPSTARLIERPGRYFEDFRLDEVIRHATPRTLTEGDSAIYTALTGSRHALWSSQPLARDLGLRARPLHDLLVFNTAFGKTVPDISLNAVANLGYAEVRFLAPVYAGDTLRCESAVIGLRPNSHGRSGIVYVRSTAYRDDDAAVLTWVRWVMVHRREPQAPLSSGADRLEHIPRLADHVPVERLATADGPRPGPALADWCEATGSQDLWDDYAPGDRILHPGGITLEEADHMTATRLYQNTARVHFDGHGMAGTPLGRRLVYGGHVISVCHALSYDGLENVLGILAINSGNHVAPCVAGDTVHAMTEVLDRWKLPGRADVGALRLRLLGLKNLPPAQFLADPLRDPAIVLDLDYTVLMPRRPGARAEA
jgi:2-methylfumaryl-CoA hydratase